jgi:hypothetical protein
MPRLSNLSLREAPYRFKSLPPDTQPQKKQKQAVTRAGEQRLVAAPAALHHLREPDWEGCSGVSHSSRDEDQDHFKT